MAAYADATWDDVLFEGYFPRSNGLAAETVERHLLRLNDTPEMRFCEDLTCVLRGFDEEDQGVVQIAFEIAGRELHLLSDPPDEPNLRIDLPAGILERIVEEDVSWDEAFIGYWCRFDRSPNVYHAGFWRLLQAPYYRRPARLSPRPAGDLGAESAIAEVLEAYGEPADRIMRRYGLYCFGCSRAPFETIRLGAQKHGLTEHELDRLVTELKAAVDGRAAEVVR
jgi:CMP-N-acetylneuraminate monooxygenase